MTTHPADIAAPRTTFPKRRLRVELQGTLQGVGFRPFIFRLAREIGLSGQVANTPQGVVLEAEGERNQLQTFLLRMEAEQPPLSTIDDVNVAWVRPRGGSGFLIAPSEHGGPSSALVLPDIAVCPDCLREMRDPRDRRHGYPFINCTNCGPRYSILKRMPYDRPNTTMADFSMCEACRAEYENPCDRRFHAQPIACPDCGPQLALWDATGAERATRGDALRQAADLLRAGQVLALKGVGGYLLLVDAENAEAVALLRERKRRPGKPFALLYPNIEQVRRDSHLEPLEERLLLSPEAPIVLLSKRGGASRLAPQVAPGVGTWGVMLPSAPLHHLLMDLLGFPVVATSGNGSDEPLCTDDQEALGRLAGIADAFLVHDRPIERPVDDSVVRVVAGREMLLRRARGYAPLPLHGENTGEPILALGAHLKNTVALFKENHLFLSQHLGDLHTPQAFMAFMRACEDVTTLYDTQPSAYAADLHPDYLSTRHAETLQARAAGAPPLFRVQHHHAHVLAAMAEHRLEGPVLGVAWDGTGHGPDGTIWGGEFLHSTRTGYQRLAHLRTFRLPGGERATQEPRRAAIGLLHTLTNGNLQDLEGLSPLRAVYPTELRILSSMLDARTNCPLTSSAGRLFDAVAALLDCCQRSTFEGQAAMLLEHLASQAPPGLAPYPMPIVEEENGRILDWEPMIRAMIADMRNETPVTELAARFHTTLATGIAEVIGDLQRCAPLEPAINGIPRAPRLDVVLTGGCFQNARLLQETTTLLEARGFKVHWPRLVPPNDGGIAVGQALFARERLREQQEVP